MKACIKCGDTNPKSWHGKRCQRCWDDDNKHRHQTPKYRYNQAVRDAKKRNKEWTITLEEYISIIEKSCYYCNDQMFGHSVSGFGLDRLNNQLGYHTNNVVQCCKVCNIIRGNFLDIEETKEVILAILDYRKIKNIFPTK